MSLVFQYGSNTSVQRLNSPKRLNGAAKVVAPAYTRVTAQIEVAGDGTKSFEDRRNALMKVRSECVMYEIAVPKNSAQN